MMSSLYIGATGIKTHGEGMAVVTNNLSNVNTVGYKQVSMQYVDLVSQFVTAGSNVLTNISQRGAGARPGDVRTLFIQGGHESGSAATDMSIDGGGFFGVTRNGQTQYTRAGNFRFSKDGRLLDPTEWNLLGHAIKDGKEEEAITPVVLDSGTGQMAPKGSSYILSCSNLGGVTDVSNDPANPFFSLASKWNGTASPPLGAKSYSYSEPFSFYDPAGNVRTGTIYYDLAGKTGGSTAVEYVMGLDDPTLDGSGRAGTQSAGLLMAGTVTFRSDGAMSNLTAFTPPASGSPDNLSDWKPASLSTDGYPVFTAQVTGSTPQAINLNMGLALSGSASAGLASAADAASDQDKIYAPAAGSTLNATASTYRGENNVNIVSKRDGYPEGSLRDVSVDTGGVITGTYSNGQTQELYRISLYRFGSQDGLNNEGHNHYSAPPAAGAIEEGKPGTENFGTVAQYSLEGSNVDYAREFTQMIITQRGFQVNSKVVTTSDEMLKRALELKR